ncbi:DUF420 domain-containing protein [Brevibacillus antibioticus]|uniref:DUF420 domain-containing protein n=1 Tax=Brevibacillus antibioticus TaxID=2570228 RepID=A0A4U2YBW0_9BACL|nr:DUF420 domain-containing protein [Brevibacillus antibioticus]TKI57805.1 DUF420 domain-containing protein [Brevibacillus antibioticus]
MKQRNYTPLIVILTIAINTLVAILYFMPKNNDFSHLDLSFLPFFNAVMNSFTFIFLIAALVSIVKFKNMKMHRGYIFAAFSTTALFLVSYVIYHGMAPSTSYGGEGILRPIYYFILITHILLSALIVPFALITTARGLNMKVEKHKKIARWTMPMWLYVSATGVIVYLMISPYY